MSGISTHDKALQLYRKFEQAGVSVRAVVVVGREIRLTLSDGKEKDDQSEEELEGLGDVQWSKS